MINLCSGVIKKLKVKNFVDKTEKPVNNKSVLRKLIRSNFKKKDLICMKKILAVSAVFFMVPAFLTGCGSRDKDDNNSESGYFDEHDYGNNHDDNRDNNNYHDGTGSGDRDDNTVGDDVHDAIDGVESAAEDIVDGAGNAVNDAIDGVGDAANDVVDGVTDDDDDNNSESTGDSTDNN